MMIVITLSKVPLSLRGDLTKWCQEVQTGVYVGNFSARIRELLWERITQNLKSGEATLIYSTNNELGYTFRTTRKDKKIVEFDGLPLMKQLISRKSNEEVANQGWSNASKFHKAKVFRTKAHGNKANRKQIVCIDIETTGLNPEKDEIIELAAVRRKTDKNLEIFHHYLRVNGPINQEITQLTGISTETLKKSGEKSLIVLPELKKFVRDDIIIGYNVRFDLEFLRFAFMRAKLKMLNNENKDLLRLVKKKNKFMNDYHLQSALEVYGIKNKKPHTAIGDATATLMLGEKLQEEGILKI